LRLRKILVFCVWNRNSLTAEPANKRPRTTQRTKGISTFAISAAVLCDLGGEELSVGRAVALAKV